MRTNAAVESMFNTIFCAVPAFIRVDPATTSGPTSGTMGIATARASSESGVQLIPTVTAPSRARFRHRPQHIRRPPAGGDAHQHVAALKPPRRKIAGPDGRIVFGGLGGAAERRFARPP